MYNLESLYHYCIIRMPAYSYFLLGVNNVLTLYKVVQKHHCIFVIQWECQIDMAPLFTFNSMSSLFTVRLHFFSLGPKINFLILILKRIHVTEICHQLFWESSKLFIKSHIYFFLISIFLIFKTLTIWENYKWNVTHKILSFQSQKI